MNSEYSNRVRADLQRWREMEKRLVDSDAGAILSSRPFLQDKLGYYRGVSARYSKSATQEEKLHLRAAARERQELEKLLYSNPLIRWIYLLTLAPIRVLQSYRNEQKQSVLDERHLKESLIQTGFGGLDSRLDQHLKQGHREFTIPVSYFMNEKSRMDFELSFGPGRNGQLQLLNYRATLLDERDPATKRAHQVKVEPGGITAQQSYQLLSGRSVKKDFVNTEGRTESTWLKMDFNDTDANGNYRIRQLAPGYSFDLREALLKFPLKELSTP